MKQEILVNIFNEEKNIWEWSFHKKGGGIGGVRYAVNKAEINKNISDGIAQIFISNMSQIEVAKKYYPDNVVILYLHATHETETKNHIIEKCRLDIIKNIINEVGCDEDTAHELLASRDVYQKELNEDIQSKLEEIKRVHDSFLEHNHQIDHVLLNTGTREDLVAQMNNLINYYIQ